MNTTTPTSLPVLTDTYARRCFRVRCRGNVVLNVGSVQLPATGTFAVVCTLTPVTDTVFIWAKPQPEDLHLHPSALQCMPPRLLLSPFLVTARLQGRPRFAATHHQRCFEFKKGSLTPSFLPTVLRKLDTSGFFASGRAQALWAAVSLAMKDVTGRLPRRRQPETIVCPCSMDPGLAEFTCGPAEVSRVSCARGLLNKLCAASVCLGHQVRACFAKARRARQGQKQGQGQQKHLPLLQKQLASPHLLSTKTSSEGFP